jgi:isoquinoline 1-oxidoreductase subunit alpha
MPEFAITVNGHRRLIAGDPSMPLLWVLRDVLMLTGTKYGCGMGLCGACTVHVENHSARSCQTSLASVAGKRIVTIEGLSAARAHPIQQAWIAQDVPQCGYCQSGQIMSAAALLAATPNPTDAQIDRATCRLRNSQELCWNTPRATCTGAWRTSAGRNTMPQIRIGPLSSEIRD